MAYQSWQAELKEREEAYWRQRNDFEQQARARMHTRACTRRTCAPTQVWRQQEDLACINENYN